MLFRALTADLYFSDAFRIWMSHRTIESNGRRTSASYIGAMTARDYRLCAKALGYYFGGLRLGEILPGHLMDYQQARALNPTDARGEWRCVKGNALRGPYAGEAEALAAAEALGEGWKARQSRWARAAGANCIRKEVSLLTRILRGAKLWGEEQSDQHIRMRAEESDVDRALTIEEQHRLLHVASTRPEYQMMYQYVIVALQTTAGTNELRALRLGDISLGDRPFIQIPREGAKNKYRMRTIPLVSRDAVWAMEGLIARAAELGSEKPSDYLFPRQASRTHYDPARPMSGSGLKKPWEALRQAAHLPTLRLYDLRHTGITRMAEAGVPLPVAMTFAGHMTQRMQQRYQAICMASKRGWGEAVWGGGGSPAMLAGEDRSAMRKPPARETNQKVQHFHRRA